MSTNDWWAHFRRLNLYAPNKSVRNAMLVLLGMHQFSSNPKNVSKLAVISRLCRCTICGGVRIPHSHLFIVLLLKCGAKWLTSPITPNTILVVCLGLHAFLSALPLRPTLDLFLRKSLIRVAYKIAAYEKACLAVHKHVSRITRFLSIRNRFITRFLFLRN